MQEINVQLGQYCASSQKQMRVLPADFVDGFDDFRLIFGGDPDELSFQSAEVQTTDKRSWLRLVGQRHDLQRWLLTTGGACQLLGASLSESRAVPRP